MAALGEKLCTLKVNLKTKNMFQHADLNMIVK